MVKFLLGGQSNDVLVAPELPNIPSPKITVSNFSGIPSFIMGTSMLPTQLACMKSTSLRDLAMAPLPFDTELVTIYMIWHERSNNDPAHKWLRDEVLKVSDGVPSLAGLT